MSNIKTLSTSIDVESQNSVRKEENAGLVTNKPCISDEFCGRICYVITATALALPFITCDLYYALAEPSCVDEHLRQVDLTMKTYLLVNGILALVAIIIFDIHTLLFGYTITSDDDVNCSSWIATFIGRGFAVSWLIVGAVMLWAYMNLSMCSKSVCNYLFARFIIGIICIVLTTYQPK